VSDRQARRVEYNIIFTVTVIRNMMFSRMTSTKKSTVGRDARPMRTQRVYAAVNVDQVNTVGFVNLLKNACVSINIAPRCESLVG
jgi:hypothetical protein